MFTITLIVIVLGIVLFLYYKKSSELQKFVVLHRELSDEIALPFIGQAYKFIGSHEDKMNRFIDYAYKSLKNKHGIYSAWLGSIFIIMVADAEAARIVSNTLLEKSDLLKRTSKLIENGGIFAPVEIWRQRRKFIMPFFGLHNINGFLPVFQQQANKFVDEISTQSGKDIFCIRKYIDAYNVAVVHETILGTQKDAKNQVFLDAFLEYSSIMADRVFDQSVYNENVLKLFPSYKREMKSADTVKEFVKRKVYEQHQADFKNPKIIDDINTDELQSKSFIDTLIAQMKEKGEFTDKELCQEIVVLLLAASDPPAIAMSYTCLILSRYPDIQEKAYQEIYNVFGDSNEPLKVSDLLKLEYLEAVIKETMRLYPPVPLTIRKVTSDLTLPSGITLPEGADCILMNWGINRSKKHWGDDAEEFKPERWLNKNLEHTQHPAAFMTFSHGVRNCPGFQYTLLSAKTLLLTILRRYRIVPAKSREEIRLQWNIMMTPVDGFPVQIIYRN